MTIRFTCDQCGSVLKIKDELAGTDGKCPKCKKRFVVPEVGADETAKSPAKASEDDSPQPEAPAATQSADDIAAAALADPPKSAPPKAASAPPTPAKNTEKSNEKPSKPSKKDDDDFDPVSFLMEGPKKKAPAFEPDEPVSPRAPAAGGRAPGGGGFSLDDDDDAPLDAPPPTKKWGARKDASAAAAADRSLGGSTNAAKDLLAKSMEESRVRAGEMPEEAPRFNFDFAGFFREFGLKAGGMVAGIIVASLGLYWIMNSMMSSKLQLPELGYFSGKVTVAGKPQAGIRVYFSPKAKTIDESKNSTQRARDSVGLTDADGNFTLYYTAEIEGVKVGQCRVFMESDDPSIPIPAKYLGREEVLVEILPGNNPSKTFEL